MEMDPRRDPQYRYITFDRPYGHGRNRYLSDSAISTPLLSLSSDGSLNNSLSNSINLKSSPARSIEGRRARKKQRAPKSLRIKIHSNTPGSCEDLRELPYLTPTDKLLADKITQLGTFFDDFKNMDHSTGTQAAIRTLEKLSEAVDSIKAEREAVALKHTREKYMALYHKALKQQAEIEWRLRVVDESNSDQETDDYREEKRALFQDYLDMVEFRNTLVQLMDDLEKLQE